MTQLKLSTEDKLSAARLLALKKWPWLRVAMFSLIPHPVPGLGTLGVSDTGILAYDPKVINRWTLAQLSAVLIHELSHIIRDHAERRKSIGISDTDADLRKLWNWAGDAEINDDLKEGGWELPDSPILPENVLNTLGSDESMDDSLMAEEYFAKLRDLLEQKREEEGGGGGGQEKGEGDDGDESGDDGSGTGDGDGDGTGGDGGDDGDDGAGGDADGDGDGDGDSSGRGQGKGKGKGEQPRVGGGWCGGCAGRPLPNETEESKKAGGGRSQAEMKGVRRATAEAIKSEAQKGRGTVPGGWERWADTELEPPKIKWESKLARMSRFAVARRPGAIDLTWMEPSRLQGGLGFGPGVGIMPEYFTPVPRVHFYADTSGSMGQGELYTVICEGQGVLKALGADMTFAAIDAKMHTVRKVHSVREMCDALVGGGGTDFRPAFEWALKLPKAERPEIILFATDGDGPAPLRPPPGIQVIWLLVGAHRCIPHAGDYGGPPITWGKIIEIDDLGDIDYPDAQAA